MAQSLPFTCDVHHSRMWGSGYYFGAPGWGAALSALRGWASTRALFSHGTDRQSAVPHRATRPQPV